MTTRAERAPLADRIITDGSEIQWLPDRVRYEVIGQQGHDRFLLSSDGGITGYILDLVRTTKENIMDNATARASSLRLMIPQLYANGFEKTCAEYAVELGRLEGRTAEQVSEEFGSCAREGHAVADNVCVYCGVSP